MIGSHMYSRDAEEGDTSRRMSCHLEFANSRSWPELVRIIVDISACTGAAQRIDSYISASEHEEVP